MGGTIRFFTGLKHKTHNPVPTEVCGYLTWLDQQQHLWEGHTQGQPSLSSHIPSGLSPIRKASRNVFREILKALAVIWSSAAFV